MSLFTGNDYSAILPFFPINGSGSQFQLKRGKQTFLSLATFSYVSAPSPFWIRLTFVFQSMKVRINTEKPVYHQRFKKTISSEIILTRKSKCLDWKPFKGNNRQWFYLWRFHYLVKPEQIMLHCQDCLNWIPERQNAELLGKHHSWPSEWRCSTVSVSDVCIDPKMRFLLQQTIPN